MRGRQINRLLITLTAAALFYAVVVTLTERHEHAVEAAAARQLEHVHRHLVIGCTLVEGEDESTCEGRWLTVLTK